MRVWTPSDGPLQHAHDHLIDELIDDPAFKAKFQMRIRAGKWNCVEWSGSRNRGYGQIDYYGRSMVAHRVAWIFRHRQNIPLHMEIDHLCMNTGCVNPDHLDVVTPEENARRILHAPDGWVSVNSPKYPRRRKLKGTRADMRPDRLVPWAS